MISLLNNERELDRNSDLAADMRPYGMEHPDVIRVSGATTGEHRSVARIDGAECLTRTVAGFLDAELVGGEMEDKAEVRFRDREVRDLDSNGGNVDSVAEQVEGEKVGRVEVSVSPEIDSRQIVETMDFRVSVVQTEDLPLSKENSGFAIQDSKMEYAATSGGVIPEVSSGETIRDAEATVEAIGSDFDSLYSLVDENSAPELREVPGAETARALRYGFDIGDMVWGKVKSHPLWPGFIYNETFASHSVRRMKREGHVLVAFFGDSSYGWFEPADLIPFERHYVDKSRQTHSRNFLKAVEEAVDEASRRRALGLACRCRNPFNFRPTNVWGYFAVDVGGYEPGAVYSVKQIKIARDTFQPAEMLSYVLQMALTSRSSEHKGIDWIKDKATVLAYRKAVFEEYDETYAQAFGVQTVRPSRDSMGVLGQPEKVPFRAPLSGPMVTAEVLGERKSSTKPMEGKDQSKKNKYLLKRREGPNDPKALYISQGQVGISVPSSFKEGVAALAAGDYVLQKRESMKPHTPGKVGAGMVSGVVSVLSQGGARQEVAKVDKKPVVDNFSLVDSPVNMNRVSGLAGYQLLSQPAAAISGAPAAEAGQEYGKQPLDREMCVMQEVKGRLNLDVVGGPINDGMHKADAVGISEYPGAVQQFFLQEGEAMVDMKHKERLKVGSTVEGFEPPRMRITKGCLPLASKATNVSSEEHRGLDKVQEGGSGIPLPSDKHPAAKIINTGSDTVMKAKKVHKPPGLELNSEKSIMMGERKKKKKKKKELGSEAVQQSFQQEGESMVDMKHEEHVKVGSTVEGFEPPRMRISQSSEDHHGLDQVREGGSDMPSLPSDMHSAGKVINMGIDTGMKAKKVRKRPGEELNSEKSILGERKKKKKKKEPGSEASLDHQQKHLKTVKDEESMRKSAGKSIGIGMDPQRKVDVANSFFTSSSLMTPSVVDMGNVDVDFPQLVDDLLSLALDPFHGVERNSSAIVRQFFLQFRSVVYQKSLILWPSTEAEASDQGYKFPVITGAVEVPPGNEGNQPSASRPPKQLFRPEHPTKAVRKRSPSDRQEEISSKKLKKLKELKSKTAEKKAGKLKNSEMQQDVKDTGVAVPAMSIQPDIVKKPESLVRVAEPTMLVMKFPPNTTLPSVPQLKARFVRFGPLDHSAIRVLWKSSTCRVVFKHKSHAHAAHDYAVRNSSLFGTNVKYFIRDLEVQMQESSDSMKRREDAADETTQSRVPSTTNSAGGRRHAAFLSRSSQPAVQLKSCLKKPTGDEAGPIVGVPRESPRVKFMLREEETSRGEQLVVSSSVNNNGSNADGGESSLAMDVNSKNFQKVVSQPPLLRLPPRSSILDVHENRAVGLSPKYHHLHHREVETRNNPNYVPKATATATTNIDISNQMLSLLWRCRDIVTDVKLSLGYGPYQPL
ncbi:hypothetical protein NE237_014380 [Protea cynaroides]|uniref:PWWP domain-containing protein n=1 Tax=Protea cynaroides TaxID=273540 RepID=A0A9Q0QQ79_9MAGN|nr:hypothetical protein NE237_014380 [Protea cynaroides]